MMSAAPSESTIEQWVERIRPNLARIEEKIAGAARRSGRARKDVTLVAVTKYHGPEAMFALLRLGQMQMGENRLQPSMPKIELIDNPGARFHFIGRLQRNKAREAIRHFHWIETVDSVKLAQRLDSICEQEAKLLPVLAQVNIGDEPQKGGVASEELEGLLEGIVKLPQLQLKGLMCIPPAGGPAETRPYFARMRELFERHADAFGLSELSMGMSADFEVAIEEGATIVRVGQALYRFR